MTSVHSNHFESKGNLREEVLVITPPSDTPDDFDAQLYLEVLREDPPLRRYVSRGDTPDDVDIPGPHQDADRAIWRVARFTMKDHTCRLQPILGPAGMGKTHLYWVIKGQEDIFAAGNFLAVYVPSPPAPIRIPLHLHTCIVDEAGDELFEETVDMLISKFGGLKGVTHEIYDYTYAMERLIVDYPGISSDAVKALLRYRLDPATRDLSRRWLLGDALSDEELMRLGIRTILEEDDVTLAMLKLLTEGSERPIVLFVDEMEGPYNAYGEEAERYFLEILKRLYNETKNVVIVASCLTEIWDRIYAIADGPTKSRMESPVHLKPFTRDDVTAFVTETMSKYWQQQNIESPPDSLFPYTEQDIDAAFNKSEGVPREAIRYLIPRLDEIIFDKKEVEVTPQEDYVIRLTATVVLDSIIDALTLAAKPLGIEVELQVSGAGTQKQQAAIVELTKDDTTQYVGIDLPNVKDWNRSGGVSAFYSAKRLKKVLDADAVKAAVIAIPTATKGAKFEALSEEIGSTMLTLRFDEETATLFVRETSDGILPHGYAESFTGLIDSLFG
ncbi:MAG: hypothetical protein ThorAB25_26430 [Candidatus Thorarchaeota archaeon AB_25]|nr:MAG: hypothetical protein ThorAB25_26430 [Candidatus Thorarchaeota archaeon AB_25]